MKELSAAKDKAFPLISKTYVGKAHAIIGFPRFVSMNYIFIVTAKKFVGECIGKKIYEIVKTQIIPLYKIVLFPNKSEK